MKVKEIEDRLSDWPIANVCVPRRTEVAVVVPPIEMQITVTFVSIQPTAPFVAVVVAEFRKLNWLSD